MLPTSGLVCAGVDLCLLVARLTQCATHFRKSPPIVEQSQFPFRRPSWPVCALARTHPPVPLHPSLARLFPLLFRPVGSGCLLAGGFDLFGIFRSDGAEGPPGGR